MSSLQQSDDLAADSVELVVHENISDDLLQVKDQIAENMTTAGKKTNKQRLRMPQLTEQRALHLEHPQISTLQSVDSCEYD